jgi:branched-chain amino acid transport system substrate-binding protein
MKAAHERDLKGKGIKLLVTGDVVEDNSLALIGDGLDGVISAHHYQLGLKNPANAAFVKAYKELFGADAVPNFRAVQAYDGMDLLYKAVEKDGGKLDSASLMQAFKGIKLDSPRGPMEIDPDTRDVIQNVYIRKGEKVDGHWQNVQIDVYKDVKDPGKTAAK